MERLQGACSSNTSIDWARTEHALDGKHATSEGYKWAYAHAVAFGLHSCIQLSLESLMASHGRKKLEVVVFGIDQQGHASAANASGSRSETKSPHALGRARSECLREVSITTFACLIVVSSSCIG